MKTPVRFDEAKFAKYVRQNAPPALLLFFRSIDPRTHVEMTSYLSNYVRRADEPMLSERKRKGAAIRKAASVILPSLRKLAGEYRELANIQGRLALNFGVEKTSLDFPSLIQSELQRLSAVIEKSRRIYGTKRMGVTGNHSWLVLLQEFVATWTRRESGRARPLKIEEIAFMLTAVKATLGWAEDNSETDPDLIGKAIANFRSNSSNDTAVKLLKSYAEERCDIVKKSPFLVGNKI